MAKKTSVTLVDDYDPAAPGVVKSHEIVLDGVEYTIDLSDANAEKLRHDLAKWIKCARRVKGAWKRGPYTSTVPAVSDPAAARTWAKANGYHVSPVGRLPAAVAYAYNAHITAHRHSDDSDASTPNP
ncbi:hypothetical protein B7435_22610 [Mycolicibacterium peregrinum]|uniref:histone-like nucleoid-structuring protein Lsr2 n=1 Tax=Mycolicibacterium peregrinum TaxID=43304 RepID=UPI000B4BED12|nr:Lsr2 family protein [Mycolicibacterium peregrinum]OWL99306.1 hypothetical protein B7435_22610 [Mycolicibacterium peregrinum]